MNKTFKRVLSLVLALFTVFGCAVVSSASTVKFGDVNGDGNINSSDALSTLQHGVGLTTLEGDAFTAADVDASGSINSSDALAILQYAVGMIYIFPAEGRIALPQTKAEILAFYTETVDTARAEIPSFKLKLTSKATAVDLSGSAVSILSREELEQQKQDMMKETAYQNLYRENTQVALQNLPAACTFTDPSKFNDITCKVLPDGNYQIDISFKDEANPVAGSPIVKMLGLPDKATFVQKMEEELNATVEGTSVPASVEVKDMKYLNCSITCVVDSFTGEIVSYKSTSDMQSSVKTYILFFDMTADTTTRTVLEYSNFVY